MKRFASAGCAAALLLAAAWPLLTWPFAPLPPVPILRYGVTEIRKEADAGFAPDGLVLRSDAGPAGTERITQTFRAAAANLNGVLLNLTATPDPTRSVHISLTERGTGAKAFDEIVAPRDLSFDHRLAFPDIPQSEGRTYEIALEQPSSHPVGVPLGPARSFVDGELSYRGQRLASELLFLPRYATKWNLLAGAAIPILVILLAAGLRSRAAGHLVVTGVMVFVGLLSVSVWQREYQFKSASEWLPDAYGTFADRIKDVLTMDTPGLGSRLLTDLRSHAHAHSPLTPLLVALTSIFVGDTVRSYLLVTLFVSVGTGWLLLLLLEEIPDLSWPVNWAVWGAGVTHYLFVRAAARTSTDPVGYFFVVLGLYLGVRALRRGPTPWTIAALVASLALGLFARLTVLPLSPVVGMALGGADLLGRRRPVLRTVFAGALVAVLPVAVFFGSIWSLGLFPTFALLREKMTSFAEARTPTRFCLCALVLLGLSLLPALSRAARRSQIPFRLLGLGWLVVFLSFIAATATFWSRHFLHALPGVLLLAAPGLERWESTRPLSVRLWLWGSVLLGLGWTAVNLVHGFGFGLPNLTD